MEPPLYIFIDESGTDNKSPILVVMAILTEDPKSLRSKIATLIDEVKRDPELGNIDSVKKGFSTFHYAEDHFEIKNKFIDILPELNFDAFASFVRKDELVDRGDKLFLILSLLRILIYPRLQEKHYKDIHIIYEKFDEGSIASEAEIVTLIQSQQKRVRNQTNKVIENINVTFADKSELILSIPDYMAGIVRTYLETKDTTVNNKDTFKRLYLRVAGKIRLLNDYARKKFYSRKDHLN